MVRVVIMHGYSRCDGEVLCYGGGPHPPASPTLRCSRRAPRRSWWWWRLARWMCSVVEEVAAVREARASAAVSVAAERIGRARRVQRTGRAVLREKPLVPLQPFFLRVYESDRQRESSWVTHACGYRSTWRTRQRFSGGIQGVPRWCIGQMGREAWKKGEAAAGGVCV